jgi:hypothetical protein
VAKIRASCFEPPVSQRLRPLHPLSATNITTNPHLTTSSSFSSLPSSALLAFLHSFHSICVGYCCAERHLRLIFVLVLSQSPPGRPQVERALHQQATNKEKNWEAGRNHRLCSFITFLHTIRHLHLPRARVALYGRSCGPVVSLLPNRQTLPPPSGKSSPIPPTNNLSSPAVRALGRTCDSFILSITYSYVSRSHSPTH